jgi:hypothetical protein
METLAPKVRAQNNYPMAKKLETDFDFGGDTIVDPTLFENAQPLPMPNPLLEEWFRADPRLTTDRLMDISPSD